MTDTQSKRRRVPFLRYLGIGISFALAIVAGIVWYNLNPTEEDDAAIAEACATMAAEGVPPIADMQLARFQGKVSDAALLCRGGAQALALANSPWVDWGNYWGTGDASSLSDRFQLSSHIFNRAKRGIDGALMDLEFQRMELIRLNLYDNQTFKTYLENAGGQIATVWPEMRLLEGDPSIAQMSVDADGNQLCQDELIRFRTMSGICNDIRNPAMGAAGQPFARNVAFETTFPELSGDELVRNRHGGRIGLLQPDPQVISRRLLARDQSAYPDCNEGKGTPGIQSEPCGYQKAPFFNVLAAFWIQFMTHDWFSHLDEARNDVTNIRTDLGCHEVDGVSPADTLGCRPDDKMEVALFDATDPPGTFVHNGADRYERAPKSTSNNVTAWWDASQIYGWDEDSRRRALRDPADPAKLLLSDDTTGQQFLPVFGEPCQGDTNTNCAPMQPEWVGQEEVPFADNWSIGLSFYHNLFAREHNAIVTAFRDRARDKPNVDSVLRDPSDANKVITYGNLSDDEIFEVARLIVSAEIAKIHTIEWTTQLLYDEPLYAGMNSNWSGLFQKFPLMSEVTDRIVTRLENSDDPELSNSVYSALAAGAGIIGRGNERRFPPYFPDWASYDRWSLANPDDINGGTNHFGSPFNFPEGFPSVYRLHALVPDMLEYRELSDRNRIAEYIPVVDTFRGNATGEMRSRGLPNIALTLGRQRLGLLLLQNHPQFLQNLDLRPRLDTTIDVIALDLIRDRERGTPRYNEFRRQIGLRQVTSYDDFTDQRLAADSPALALQRDQVDILREVYGQHICDDTKVITNAQANPDGSPITDCLGHPDGTMVDNVEDIDLLVGFHAENTRPHGFAISETQFHIFILNASRRLFSDRFFTSSFRPEFYTNLGIDWVMDNGPTGKHWEVGMPNGHKQEVSPMKRLLSRNMPELEDELSQVVNVFDPWARARGEYYSLDWVPRPDATDDPAFRN